MLPKLASLLLRIAVYSMLAMFAIYSIWSRFGQHSFGRWNPFGGAYKARNEGPGLIRSYLSSNIDSIDKAGTYKDADLSAVFEEYAKAYRKVTSRKCDYALEDLMVELKTVFSNEAKAEMRKGIIFVSGVLWTTTYTEPDNILVLLPTQYDKEWEPFGNPGWYDTEAKKHIIFFYPGSIPLKPVGNLYKAVAESSEDEWGVFERLAICNNIPEEKF